MFIIYNIYNRSNTIIEIFCINNKTKGVSAINGGELLVKFNKAVDETTAQDTNSYTLTGTSKTVTGATLQEDGKSVVLTLSTAVASTTSETFGVTVKGVALDGSSTTFPIFSGTVTVADTTSATVTGVTSATSGATASSITVNFSEPVQNGYIIIDGGVTKYSVTAGTSTTISSLSLDATKQHKVEVVNLQDAAGNVAAYQSKDFAITQDAALPVISSVSAFNDNQILVTFSKKMKKDVSGNLVDAAGAAVASSFKVKDETLTDLNAVASVVAQSGDTTGTKFVLTFNPTAGTFYANSTTRNLTVVVANNVLVDTLGNKLAGTTKTVSLVKDATAPTVTGSTVKKDANGVPVSFTLNFSEAITLGTGVATVVDESGLLQSAAVGAPALGADGKSLVYSVTGLSGKISVSIPSGSAKDTALTPNSSAAFSGLVDLGTLPASSGKFTIDPAKIVVSGKVIKVVYPTAVKGGLVTGSATDIANYSLGGASLPAGTTITLNAASETVGVTAYAAQQVATITLPAGSIAADTNSAIFRVNNVVATNGTTANPLLTTLSINDNTAPVLQSARLVSTNGTTTAVYELTYSEAMNQGLDGTNDVFDELVFKKSGSAIGTAAVANKVAGFNNKVLVTVTGAIASSDTITITTKATAAPGVADLVDNSTGVNVEAVGTTVTAN